jgi:hypothetical protein
LPGVAPGHTTTRVLRSQPDGPHIAGRIIRQRAAVGQSAAGHGPAQLPTDSGAAQRARAIGARPVSRQTAVSPANRRLEVIRRRHAATRLQRVVLRRGAIRLPRVATRVADRRRAPAAEAAAASTVVAVVVHTAADAGNSTVVKTGGPANNAGPLFFWLGALTAPCGRGSKCTSLGRVTSYTA